MDRFGGQAAESVDPGEQSALGGLGIVPEQNVRQGRYGAEIRHHEQGNLGVHTEHFGTGKAEREPGGLGGEGPQGLRPADEGFDDHA